MDLDPTAAPGSGTVRDRLRHALPRAMKARDAVAVAALRSALAAIDNAEAVDPADVSQHVRFVVGTSADVGRRILTASQMEDLVRAEIADRRAVLHDYQRAGRPDQAERLRAEADILAAHLDGGESPAG